MKIYEITTYNFYENNGNNKWVKMKMVNYVTMVNSKPTLEWNTVILRSPQAYEKFCKIAYICTLIDRGW